MHGFTKNAKFVASYLHAPPFLVSFYLFLRRFAPMCKHRRPHSFVFRVVVAPHLIARASSSSPSHLFGGAGNAAAAPPAVPAVSCASGFSSVGFATFLNSVSTGYMFSNAW